MSINPLNDISRVYLEQVAIKEAVDQDADKDTDFADVRIARMIASGVPREVAIQKTKNKPYNKKIKSVRESLIGKQSEIDANKNGKIDSQDFKILRSTKKKKVTKEGFSNWREDLVEIVDKISKDKSEDVRITDKKVDNKIDINPRLDLGEAVENLGGTLLEMVEIDEVDYIVESVYEELLEEGYEEDDIEEALEYALVEAKVTFGHDTPETKKKKGRNLLGAVGRLARQKLSSKYRGARRAVSSAAVSGLRNVARGALGAARKLEGDKKPSKVHSKSGVRSASTYRGAGVGQRERVSSGSHSTPKSEAPKPEQKKASTPVADPRGPATTPSKKPAPKPQAKTTKVPAKTSEPDEGLSARRQAADERSRLGDLEYRRKIAALRLQKRKLDISPQDIERVISNIKEDYYDLTSKSVKSGKPGEEQKRTIETLASIARTKKKTRTPVGTARRGSATFKPSSPEEAKENKKSWSDYWSTAAKGYKEEYNLLEKAESEQQQKIFGLALSVKRGQTPRSEVSDRVLKIVDGMSEKEIRKFAKTKHEGLPHKVETKEEVIKKELIARMIAKIDEQAMEIAPKVQNPQEKPQNSSAINQVLRAKATADAAERDLANKQRIANQKGVNLASISP